MLKVGLTGGYASGKTFVSRRLESLGCKLIYADILGHEALAPAGQAYQPTIDFFGPRILRPDGTIDRKTLASIVFDSPEQLKKLNSFVHPAVFLLEEEAVKAYRRQNSKAIVVLEAAILIETGRYTNCDRLIVTSCTVQTQISRATQRDGITRAEASARIAQQLSDEERRRVADYVIQTEGPIEETTKQIDTVFVQLRQLAEAA